MRIFQGTDAITWSPKTHVDRELEWENGVTFIMFTRKIFKEFIKCIILDSDLMVFAVNHCLSKLATRPERTIPFHRITIPKEPEWENKTPVEVWGASYSIFNVDINSFPVSMYCPLSRVLTSVLRQIDDQHFAQICAQNCDTFSWNCVNFFCIDSLAALCLGAQGNRLEIRSSDKVHRFFFPKIF